MSEDPLFPADHIRHREVDGLEVLMDLDAGDYLVLDPAATAMWRALTGHAAPAARERALAAILDAPAERVAADLAAFRDECLQRRLLQRRPPRGPRRQPARRAARGAWTARAWWSLLVTRLSLRRRGFPSTFAACARLPRPAASSEDRLRRAVRAFRRAERLFGGRGASGDCLPRSLALFRFLLSVGVEADHCIGVRRRPFEAHAWVESGGRVLADSPAVARRFVELARTRGAAG